MDSTTLISELQAQGELLHNLGANIVAIPQGEKGPTYTWGQWHTQRQTLEDVRQLPWRSAAGLGVVHGIGGVRCFDVDECEGYEVVLTILRALGLPDDYPWIERTRRGWHIWVICHDPMPDGALPAKKDGAGVFKGLSKDSTFDHLEVRWQNCQTIITPSIHADSGQPYRFVRETPTDAPATVTVGAIINAFYAVAKRGEDKPVPAPKPRRQVPINERSGDVNEDIRQRIDLVAFGRHLFRGEERDERNGEVRITGHGGLLIKPEKNVWYNFLDEVGGDCFDLAGHALYNGTWDRNDARMFLHAQQEAATFAGVTIPDKAPQPAFDAGIAYCPHGHGQIVRSFNGNGWRCPAQCGFWWQGESYAPPADAPARVDPETGEILDNATPSKKKRLPSSQQIRDALHALGYKFRYNAVTLTMEINGKPISDAVEATIRVRMRDRGYTHMGAIEDVYMSLAHEHTYNPIRDYLESLTWDGNPHIARFADHVTCVDAPVVYADGQKRGLFYVYLYRWMMGAVAKVYANEQNMMLVLEGPQGVGKSTIAEWLASPLPNYFVSQSIQTDDKDSALRLARNFVWEVDELGATIRRSDVEALKSFITHKHIVVRPAYARRDIHVPAMASMIGTINKGAGFLSDPTGSRRFYVTGISAIDWNYTKIDVNQMWAQAVHDYKDGVAQGRKPWKLQASEDVRRKDANQEREVRTLLDDWINMDLYLDGGQDTGMTAAEIIDHFRERGHILSGTSRAQAMELADALLKRGITRKQVTINGIRAMYYLGVTKNVS